MHEEPLPCPCSKAAPAKLGRSDAVTLHALVHVGLEWLSRDTVVAIGKKFGHHVGAQVVECVYHHSPPIVLRQVVIQRLHGQPAKVR